MKLAILGTGLVALKLNEYLKNDGYLADIYSSRKNKKFLDSQKYHDASIYYILKKEQDGAVSYKGVAEYEQEMAVYFSISKEEVTEGVKKILNESELVCSQTGLNPFYTKNKPPAVSITLPLHL